MFEAVILEITVQVDIWVLLSWVGDPGSTGRNPVFSALAARPVVGTFPSNPGNPSLVPRLVGRRDFSKHCVGRGMKWAENEVKGWVCETPGWARPGCLGAAFQHPPAGQLVGATVTCCGTSSGTPSEPREHREETRKDYVARCSICPPSFWEGLLHNLNPTVM